MPAWLALKEAWQHREVVLLLVVAFLCLAVRAQHETIRGLRGELDAKPAVQERVVTKTVEGPVIVKWRTIVKPGGERITERTRYVKNIEKNSDNSYKEEPAALFATQIAQPWRYLGAASGPFKIHDLRLRAGVTFWNRLDLGAAYDPRFSPNSGAFQVETALRF